MWCELTLDAIKLITIMCYYVISCQNSKVTKIQKVAPLSIGMYQNGKKFPKILNEKVDEHVRNKIV